MPHEEFDPPFQDWKVGDAVYGRFFDQRTGRYVIRGIGRVIRIEGTELVLATKRGEQRRPVQIWPAWKTRAEGEAHLAKYPSPYASDEPMAHHGAPASSSYECLRCERLRAGRDPMVPEHALRCPYRGTGRDPDPSG